jgi:hypothetical protein
MKRFLRKAQIQQESITNSKLTEIEVDFNYQVCKDVCINLEKLYVYISTFKKLKPTVASNLVR